MERWRTIVHLTLITGIAAACQNRNPITATPIEASTEGPDPIPTLPSTPEFAVTQLDVFRLSDREVAIQACTEGRPVGTTMRVSVSEHPVSPDFDLSDEEALNNLDWQIIKELGVPCFEPYTNLHIWDVSQ